VNETMSVSGSITLAIAILGAVLGIINTWRNINKDKVKLKVIPKYAIFSDGEKEQLCIEVINFSTFPLTIKEVGVQYYGTSERGAVIKPYIYDGGSFPRKLEQRTSLSAYLPIEILKSKDDHKVKCVYAMTDCGEIIKGKSPALKEMINKAREN
jgi:hypothetical protein